MKKLSIFKVIALSFSLLFFYSCNRDEISSSDVIATSSFKNSKILEFKDMKDYVAKFNEVSKMNKVELNTWEKSNNFISLRSIYDDVVEKELAILAEEEKKIIENPKLKETFKHKFSSLYEDNKKSILLQDGFEVNAPTLAHAALINKDRVVKIGGVIHQFSKDKTKVIKNGDESLIPSLDKYEQEGNFGNILVYPILSNSKSLASKSLKVKGEIPCENIVGDYRLRAYLTYSRTQLWASGGTEPVTHFYTTLTSEHKRNHWLWGWINHNTTSYSANGSGSQSGYNNVFTDMYNGGYINFDAYHSINESAFAGHTSYAQRTFFSAWTEGHQYYFPHFMSDVNFNMQFLDCNCVIQ